MRLSARHILASAILASALWSGIVCAASFAGRVVDGARYSGSAQNHLFGKITNCSISFSSEKVYIRTPGGALIVGFMEEEIISDPRSIECYDPKRSLYWVVSVDDMR